MILQSQRIGMRACTWSGGFRFSKIEQHGNLWNKAFRNRESNPACSSTLRKRAMSGWLGISARVPTAMQELFLQR